MKTVLIYLPHPYLRQPDAQAPLGLLYLTAVLEAAGEEVELKNYSSWDFDAAVADLPEADLYGITVTSLEIHIANRFAASIKQKYPASAVIAGGPGTVTPEYFSAGIDSICHGEGEHTVMDILADMRNGGIRPVYYGRSVENLDTLPFPARHRLDVQGGNVFAYNHNYHDGGSTIVLTSRGCPYHCAFCSTGHIPKPRLRSAQNVYDEIRQVKEEFDIRQFRFSDDMFIMSRQRVIDICNLIGPLDVTWRISTRTKPIDAELYKIMFDAGCREVSFGVESFDDHVLETLNKKATARDHAKALETAHRVGMKARVLFMIRTPGQNRNTVPVNIRWLDRLPWHILCCTTFVPLPGSAVWSDPDKYGVTIKTRDLEQYNFYCFSPDGENDPADIIGINGRDPAEVDAETLFFKDYLKSTNQLNMG